MDQLPRSGEQPPNLTIPSAGVEVAMWRRSASIKVALPTLAFLLAPMSAGATAPPDCSETLIWDGSPGYGVATPMPLDEALPLVQREAEGLRLVTDTGDVLVRDHPDCVKDGSGYFPVECHYHRFVDAFEAPRGYLLHRQFFEGDEHAWVDRADGSIIEFAHRPRFSPGGDWMLSVSPSEAYNFNGIELFAVRDRHRLEKVWQHVPSGAPETYDLFTFLRWEASETAILCAKRAGDEHPLTPVLLRRGEFGWALGPLR